MSSVIALRDLPAFCKKITARFEKRQLVLLKGPLGAGKTQFVKLCVQELGGDMPDSPTFSLINEYADAGSPVYHADLYRLTSDVDIDSTGFWDLFREPEGLIFVEWPETVADGQWPLTWPRLTVEIAFTDKDDAREFKIL